MMRLQDLLKAAVKHSASLKVMVLENKLGKEKKRVLVNM
jgi:hypothetical protein